MTTNEIKIKAINNLKEIQLALKISIEHNDGMSPLVMQGYQYAIKSNFQCLKETVELPTLESFTLGSSRLHNTITTLELVNSVLDKCTASTEGLSDIIRRVKDYITGRDSKPTIKQDYERDMEALIVEFKKTYLNDTWLKNARIVETDIKFNDIAKSLIYKGQYLTDTSKIYTAIKETVSKIEQLKRVYIPIVSDYDKKVQSIHKEVCDNFNKNKNHEEAFKYGVDKIKKLQNPLVKLTSSLFPIHGLTNDELKINKDKSTLEYTELKPKTDAPETLNALSMSQIKDMAKNVIVMISAYKDNEPVNSGFVDFEDGENIWEEVDTDAKYANEYLNLTYYQNVDDRLIYPYIYLLLGYLDTAKAMHVWIDRSVK